MKATRADVLVLGGGVIGLACALHLLRKGVGVCVLEQGAPGCGASHGNCGTVTPSHAAPLAMPGMLGIAMRSMLRADAPLYLNPRFDGPRLRWLLGFARHCNWADFHRAAAARSAILQRSRRRLVELVHSEGLDCEFAEEGELYVYRTAQALADDERHHAAVLDRLGVDVQRLGGDALEAMEPALKPGVAGGLFHPGDARLRPDRYAAELARRVSELGGVIECGARIEGFDTDGKRIAQVRTSHGVFAGERVLLALGAWSPLLARPLGLRLPMQPGKGYSITYTRPARAPRHALVLREASYPAVLYIPREDADMSLLQRTDHATYCPYKGDCAYYSIPAGGERSINAVWTYEHPNPAVESIRGHLAFYPDRVDAIEESAAGTD